MLTQKICLEMKIFVPSYYIYYTNFDLHYNLHVQILIRQTERAKILCNKQYKSQETKLGSKSQDLGRTKSSAWVMWLFHFHDSCTTPEIPELISSKTQHVNAKLPFKPSAEPVNSNKKNSHASCNMVQKNRQGIGGLFF